MSKHIPFHSQYSLKTIETYKVTYKLITSVSGDTTDSHQKINTVTTGVTTQV